VCGGLQKGTGKGWKEMTSYRKKQLTFRQQWWKKEDPFGRCCYWRDDLDVLVSATDPDNLITIKSMTDKQLEKALVTIRRMYYNLEPYQKQLSKEWYTRTLKKKNAIGKV
jgi:hypothetical protein